MAKPTANFKLSKTAKRMTALMGGPADGRNQFKRMMIDAELSAQFQPKREKSARGPRSE